MERMMTRKSTMQSFAAGDLLVGCTLLNDPDDDHGGEGRILQYDRNFNLKGELWTEGGDHLVGGLEFDRNGLLWAFNDHAVIHVDPHTGRQLELASFPSRAFYSAAFASDGSVYLGEHRNALDPPTGIEKFSNMKMMRTPDTGVLGYGNIYKFSSDWELEREFDVENAPEFLNFKGVTHMALHPSDRFMTYATETTTRILRYDLVNDCQMPDLFRCSGDGFPNGAYVAAVEYLADGRLLATQGAALIMLGETGEVLREYPLQGSGWSHIEACQDGEHALVSNIWQGLIIKLHLASGEVISTLDTGFKAPNRCVAGVAEFPGI
jgi:hypothetical protein